MPRWIDAPIAHRGTVHNDKYPDLKADYALANMRFNDSDWRGDLSKDEKRWVAGLLVTAMILRIGGPACSLRGVSRRHSVRFDPSQFE